MSIAAVVGAERLREIMTELVNRAMAVVQRYGATVDQFTGEFFLISLPALELYAARERVGLGDVDEVLPLMRQAVDALLREKQVVQGIWGSAVLAEALMKRGADG
jgi:class 3 adenylate cyclase